MFGQIIAFFAVAASVAFAQCDNCYSGYGVYLNAEPGLSIIPRGAYQSRILTESPIRISPVEVPASRGCSTQVVSAPVEIPAIVSRGCSAQVVSAPVEIPAIVSRGCSAQIVSSPVEINTAPVFPLRGCSSSLVEARDSQFLTVGPCGKFVKDICDSCKTYTTPVFRRAVGGSEVYSSCENSCRPAICVRQAAILSC